MLKKLLNKEDYKKVMLIKKYAKIRFRRFWKEWGISKEDFACLMGGFSLFGLLASVYILGYIFL